MVNAMDEIRSSYSNLAFHRDISKVIRTQSKNRQDIRVIAQQMVDWTGTAALLDLGCGYGWFEETLKSPLRLLYGVDYLKENEAEFLKTGRRVAERTVFKALRLPATIDMPPASFDLVVCAYSLYFFPDMLGEVRRLLRAGGTLLAITHSESMLEEGERFFDFRNLRTLIRRFSAENGEGLLREYFREAQFTDYNNALVFTRDDPENLEKYIIFKKEFISRDVDPEVVRTTLLRELSAKGEIRLNKNDRIFVVRK
jgi:SAM-dependent methyltransferase